MPQTNNNNNKKKQNHKSNYNEMICIISLILTCRKFMSVDSTGIHLFSQ